jgi:hypothetical protein
MTPTPTSAVAARELAERLAFEVWAGPRLRYSPKVVIGDPLEWVVDWDGSAHYYKQQTHWMFEAWRAALAAQPAAPAVLAEWLSVEEHRPDVNAVVLVASTNWDRPKVLKYEARQLTINRQQQLSERFIDNDTGRWYWYPERMHWQAISAPPSGIGSATTEAHDGNV